MTRTPRISGDKATFIWHGDIAPELIGDFNLWNRSQPLKLEKVEQGVWEAEMQLPEDAYIEYAYLLQGEHVPDPGNPRRVSNGFDKFNNYFYMPQAAPTPLSRRRSNLPHGVVTEHSLLPYPGLDQRGVAVSLRRRMLTLYSPAQDGPYPLLLVYDGNDYLRHGRLFNILDNLIDQGRIQPLAIALLSNGGPLRFVEYNCSDTTLDFVERAVLPLARQHLDLLDCEVHPGAYGVMGASLGGLMAMYTAFRMPQLFGRVLSQSGAFFPRSVLFDLVRLQERLPLDIWMDVGRLEWLLDANRAFVRLLASRGYQPTYREYSGGHNYTAWRDDLWRGLLHLFGTQP